jgi:Fasciclin domain
LKHLLRHHMVSGQMWTANQLSDGQTLTMRSGETVNVVKKTNTSSTNTTGMTAGSSITLDGSVSITVADLRADNGVVHVVNGLLRPDFLSRSVMGVTEQMKTTSVFASLLELTGLADELENLDAEFTVRVKRLF